MFKEILIANRGEILPETGRGTTKWWRGPAYLQALRLKGGTPPSVLRTATSPFRGGFLFCDFLGEPQ
jgi:hypothetical protein